MATYTSNYNLKKPALADKIRVADFNGNFDTIDGAMNDNATLIANLKSDLGVVENTNTATHNISAGQYVIWKGSLYTASDAISSGATLSNANLTAVSGGGLNALNSKFYTVISSGDNLNNYKNSGMFFLNASASNIGNCPSGGGYSAMIVIGVGTTCQQMLFNNSYIFHRALTGSPAAWTNWRRIAQGTEI